MVFVTVCLGRQGWSLLKKGCVYDQNGKLARIENKEKEKTDYEYNTTY